MEVLLLVLIGLIVLFLIIGIAVLYGMDLGLGWCDNFIDCVKKEHELNKEVAKEMKDHKAFLKTHPLCMRCQEEGKYRKAVRVFDRQKEWEALCQRCWDKAEEDYFCGWA